MYIKKKKNKDLKHFGLIIKKLQIYQVRYSRDILSSYDGMNEFCGLCNCKNQFFPWNLLVNIALHIYGSLCTEPHKSCSGKKNKLKPHIMVSG
jgi:hypothetical protein